MYVRVSVCVPKGGVPSPPSRGRERTRRCTVRVWSFRGWPLSSTCLFGSADVGVVTQYVSSGDGQSWDGEGPLKSWGHRTSGSVFGPVVSGGRWSRKQVVVSTPPPARWLSRDVPSDCISTSLSVPSRCTAGLSSPLRGTGTHRGPSVNPYSCTRESVVGGGLHSCQVCTGRDVPSGVVDRPVYSCASKSLPSMNTTQCVDVPTLALNSDVDGITGVSRTSLPRSLTHVE